MAPVLPSLTADSATKGDGEAVPADETDVAVEGPVGIQPIYAQNEDMGGEEPQCQRVLQRLGFASRSIA
jgi:hypothetical protein